MEKVKITQEQEDAIKGAKDKFYMDSEELLIDHTLSRGYWEEHGFGALDELSVETLAKALYIGYEVEPEFKAGEWVVNEHDGAVSKIRKIVNGRAYFDNLHGTLEVELLRHATPEEIAKEKQSSWWSKNGRGVWELHRGDVIVDKRHSRYFFVTGFVFDRYYVQPINYIDEESHPYQTKLIDEVKDNFKVAFFVEDRKYNGRDSN